MQAFLNGFKPSRGITFSACQFSVINMWPVKFAIYKGPVKLIKQVKIAHSFFANHVRSVPRYHFKLTYVIL